MTSLILARLNSGIPFQPRNASKACRRRWETIPVSIHLSRTSRNSSFIIISSAVRCLVAATSLTGIRVRCCPNRTLTGVTPTGFSKTRRIAWRAAGLKPLGNLSSLFIPKLYNFSPYIQVEISLYIFETLLKQRRSFLFFLKTNIVHGLLEILRTAQDFHLHTQIILGNIGLHYRQTHRVFLRRHNHRRLRALSHAHDLLDILRLVIVMVGVA